MSQAFKHWNVIRIFIPGLRFSCFRWSSCVPPAICRFSSKVYSASYLPPLLFFSPLSLSHTHTHIYSAMILIRNNKQYSYRFCYLWGLFLFLWHRKYRWNIAHLVFFAFCVLQRLEPPKSNASTLYLVHLKHSQKKIRKNMSYKYQDQRSRPWLLQSVFWLWKLAFLIALLAFRNALLAFPNTLLAFPSASPASPSSSPAFLSVSPAFPSASPAFPSVSPDFPSALPAFPSALPAFPAVATKRMNSLLSFRVYIYRERERVSPRMDFYLFYLGLLSCSTSWVFSFL